MINSFVQNPPHIHIRLCQRAAVAGCCHACGWKQRLVCCQSGLLLKAQILLVFHNIQPLCVPCAESPTALTPSSLLCSDLRCVEGSSSPTRAKQPNYPEQKQLHQGLFARGSCPLPGKRLFSVLPRNWGALPVVMHLNWHHERLGPSWIYIYLPRSLFLTHSHTHTLPQCGCCCRCMPACVFISGSSQHGRHVLCYC